MDFFISPAYAQAAQQPSPFGFLLPMLIIFAAFYFLLIRPQQKKQKQQGHRDQDPESEYFAGRAQGHDRTSLIGR